MFSAKKFRRLSEGKDSLDAHEPLPAGILFLVVLACVVVCLPAMCSLQITEFMAINDETVIDDDDDRSDWIEIHNPTKYPINLKEWYLTNDPDDLTRWGFPDISLASKGYLIVFASEKDRPVLGSPVHTNFKLSNRGYLGLISPALIPVSEFFPEYPRQRADVSYGIAQEDGPCPVGYFETPTPGMKNGPAFSGIAGEVSFSIPGTPFTKSLSLELFLPEDAGPDAVIRYTLNGSIPDESSTIYTKPLVVSTTTQVRARVLEPGLGKGPIASETYLGLDSKVPEFTSNLPLVVLETFGGGSIPYDTYEPTFMAIFEPGDGRSSLLNAPTLTTRAGIAGRGASTAGRPKLSLKVEAWDEQNGDKNISPLGMPAESDWVLWGPYNFDLALMRNPFIYELSNQVGRYAARGRHVEVFLNTGGGRLSDADYWGVYVLMEKISRDADRVDVEKLFPEHDREPGVTGGYILKIDRLDPADQGFSAAGQALCYVYPKEIEIEVPERDSQETYIRSFMNQFGTALNGLNFTDPENGYAKYLDVGAAVDHHLINILSKNPDALRLSTYMHKLRGGKLTFGPVWDFDRTMGSTDGRDANPTGWDGGTDFFNYPWWGRLFQDNEFFQKYIDRWQELRKDQFSVKNVRSIIDGMAEEIREAQVRDLARWNQRPRSEYGGTFQGEVDHLKDWLETRLVWMDQQFVAAPVFGSNGEKITPGLTLTMTAPVGATIYYTLDGSDPRLAGGKPTKQARAYTGPVPITKTSDVVARANMRNTSPNPNYYVANMSDWSGLTRARFSPYAPATAGNLVITEFNYHPVEPTPQELAVNPAAGFVEDDFEYVELKNIGDTRVDLVGVEFIRGILFSFRDSSVTTLRPGEIALVVKNRAAFQTRYGNLNNIAGEYAGHLDNGGETIRLNDAAGSAILNFGYQDEWYPLTDGVGFSVVVFNENARADDLTNQAGWRPSTYVGGSPQQNDPAPPRIPPIVINEALANGALPQVDAIELYNPTSRDADIGGWYLTNDGRSPQRYRIPDGTTVPANGYILFDESEFNAPDAPKGSRFALNPVGDKVYLFSADSGGNLTGYWHGFMFGASDEGATFGRHVISTGEEHFVSQASQSLERVNAGPWVGPVVINEIMYQPPSLTGDDNTAHEYLELCNISSETVLLFDSESPASTWRIEGDVDFVFPTGVTLSPGEPLLVVSFNPEAEPDRLLQFLAAYSLGLGVRVLGPYSHPLENSGERVRLLKPDLSWVGTGMYGDQAAYVVVDQVDYASSSPWPEGANASGNSLQRLVADAYGNDPLNWYVASPTPSAENAGGGVLDADGDGMPNHWESAYGLNPLVATGEHGASGDPDGDGLTNVEEYISGTHPRDPTSSLKVSSITMNATAAVLQFLAVAGKSYTVLYCDALSSGTWRRLTDIAAPSETGLIELHDRAGGKVGTRFYRLVTPQLP